MKKIILIGIIALTGIGLLTFLWETYNYQCVYLPKIWKQLSFEQQQLANLVLQLMDLKIILTGVILAGELYFLVKLYLFATIGKEKEYW